MFRCFRCVREHSPQSRGVFRRDTAGPRWGIKSALEVLSLNESIVENLDLDFERFGELGYAIGHGPHSGWSDGGKECIHIDVEKDSGHGFISASSPSLPSLQAASFPFAVFSRRQAWMKNALQNCLGHVFSITQVPELAITETMNIALRSRPTVDFRTVCSFASALSPSKHEPNTSS